MFTRGQWTGSVTVFVVSIHPFWVYRHSPTTRQRLCAYPWGFVDTLPIECITTFPRLGNMCRECWYTLFGCIDHTTWSLRQRPTRRHTFRAPARGDTFSFAQHTMALLSIRNSVYTCIPPFKWVKSPTLIKPTKIYIQYKCIIQLEHTVCPSDLGSRIHKVPLLMGTSPDHYEPPLSNY